MSRTEDGMMDFNVGVDDSFLSSTFLMEQDGLVRSRSFIEGFVKWG